MRENTEMPTTVAPSQPKRRLSLLFSFRNEEDVLPELLQRVRSVASALPVNTEFIFINDASTDRSLELLTAEARQDPRVKIINMSRRFGVAECYLAGMGCARGDAVITMDTDLQDPPEVIPELVEKWLAGAEVVYTIRTKRAGESTLKLLLTRLAYKAIRLVSNEAMPVEAGDFKLIGRRVVEQLIRLNEKDPYLRGLVTWMGFKQTPVYYQREARAKGTTHFPLLRSKGPILTFAIGLTSFSIVPLLGFLIVGLLLTVLAVLGGVVLCGIALFGSHPPREFWWLLAAGGLFSGLQLAGIGTVGIYLGRVYTDVRNRPRFIVESTVGFTDQSV
jgi:dolichol-phosphate mannosyltransferase